MLLGFHQRHFHFARHAFPTSILIAHALSLARRHHEEQLIDVAIIPVVESFLSSSTAVACWVTGANIVLHFGMNVPSEGELLAHCAGCVLLITFSKCAWRHYSRTPYFVLDRPSSAGYGILRAEEEVPEQLGARLHLVSDDMGDHPAMIALPPGPRALGRGPPAAPIVNDRSVVVLWFLPPGVGNMHEGWQGTRESAVVATSAATHRAQQFLVWF